MPNQRAAPTPIGCRSAASQPITLPLSAWHLAALINPARVSRTGLRPIKKGTRPHHCLHPVIQTSKKERTAHAGPCAPHPQSCLAHLGRRMQVCAHMHGEVWRPFAKKMALCAKQDLLAHRSGRSCRRAREHRQGRASPCGHCAQAHQACRRCLPQPNHRLHHSASPQLCASVCYPSPRVSHQPPARGREASVLGVCAWHRSVLPLT